MKIEMTEGCTCFSYLVDGKEFDDLGLDGQRAVVHSLVDKMDNPAVLLELFRDMVYHSESKYYCSDGPCECCGDYIETYKLEI